MYVRHCTCSTYINSLLCLLVRCQFLFLLTLTLTALLTALPLLLPSSPVRCHLSCLCLCGRRAPPRLDWTVRFDRFGSRIVLLSVFKLIVPLLLNLQCSNISQNILVVKNESLSRHFTRKFTVQVQANMSRIHNTYAMLCNRPHILTVLNIFPILDIFPRCLHLKKSTSNNLHVHVHVV